MADEQSITTRLPALPDEEAKGYQRASKAANTVRAYSSDWAAFTSWCDQHGVSALPASPGTLAVYLAEAARTLKPSTLTRRCSSVSMAHQMAGHDSPTKHITVRTTMAGIRREKGTAPSQKSPILTADLRAMVATLPETLAGARDRALLLLGFAGALRRSELVAIDVEHLDDRSDGLVVTVVRSKTDQEGGGRKIGIPYGSNPSTCPVRAVRAWLERSGIKAGPLFRPVRHGQVLPSRLTGRSVALVVKRVGQAAGLNPTDFAGHSLRAGLVTSAAAAGVAERAIMIRPATAASRRSGDISRTPACSGKTRRPVSASSRRRL